MWTLSITDDTPGTSGILNRWQLDVATLQSPVASTTSAYQFSGAPIPDGASGGVVLEGEVNSTQSFLTGVRLSAQVLYQPTSHINLYLTSPQGTTVTLSTGNGGDIYSAYYFATWNDRGQAPVSDTR